MALATHTLESHFRLPSPLLTPGGGEAEGPWAVAASDEIREDEDEAEDEEADSGSSEGVVVPQVDEQERSRIRQSNDRDQALERQGENAPHNDGYDDAAKGGNRER